MNLTIKVDWTWLILLGLLAVPFAGKMDGCASPFAPAGPRTLLIVHEQESDTPAWGAFVKDIRAGESGKYIAEKKHHALILDKDSKDGNGQPLPLLAKYAPYDVPELLILSPAGSALHREKLPVEPKAADVLATLKKNGG